MFLSKKKCKEWTCRTLWGKIALISWGEISNPPVLMVHGYMDSAATFIPLVELLPDSYYYVGLDFPGHGRSDPFPYGKPASTIDLIEVIRVVIEHLKWRQFAYIGHSQGAVLGFHYNFLFPGRITKMVNLDPTSAFGTYFIPIYNVTGWYKFVYDDHFETYYSRNKSRLLTYEKLINMTVKRRKVSAEQAKILLSRSVVPADGGMYRITSDPRNKQILPIIMPEETIYKILTTNTPPMLTIVSSDKSTTDEAVTSAGRSVVENLRESLTNHCTIDIEGVHDVHVSNPEKFVSNIIEFLNKDSPKMLNAKL